MAHAEFPSLISLGPPADVSQETSSFRWGLAISGLLHALVIILAVFLRFQSTVEEPFRSIDVTLISLPDAQAPAPSQKKSSPPATSPKKSQPIKKEKVEPTKKAEEPPKAKPIEETLPPLPVPTTSERFSEFLEGAVRSIVVPDKQEMVSPASPPKTIEQPPSLKDQTPLIGNLRMPPTAPKFSRPEHLQSAQRLPESKTPPARPPKPTMPPTTVSPEPQKPVPQPSPPKIEPAVKPAPELPELRSVTPFKRSQKENRSHEAPTSSNLEETLKRTIPTIPVPAPTPKIKRQPKISKPQEKKPFIPEVSAPPLTRISPPPPQEKPPQREKMSDMMKQLLEEATVPNLKPTPPLPQQPVTSSSTRTEKVQSEIDQRIAKLSIPNVTPVESIKQRLQLLEVQSTSNSDNASLGPSPGNNRYLALVQDKIENQWRKTPLIANAPIVILKFRIYRSGEILNIRIDESSGNEYYDSSARRAVSAVNPLPPFPADISDSFLEVRFQFIKTDQKD